MWLVGWIIGFSKKNGERGKDTSTYFGTASWTVTMAIGGVAISGDVATLFELDGNVFGFFVANDAIMNSLDRPDYSEANESGALIMYSVRVECKSSICTYQGTYSSFIQMIIYNFGKFNAAYIWFDLLLCIQMKNNALLEQYRFGSALESETAITFILDFWRFPNLIRCRDLMH